MKKGITYYSNTVQQILKFKRSFQSHSNYDDRKRPFVFYFMTSYDINITKKMKKKIKTPNILIINARFFETDRKYLRISL
uniref:CSON010658 protein n=1 Tax=Culicoides sonorensis TaxID=179676 RepID=A0A336M601_CULSO